MEETKKKNMKLIVIIAIIALAIIIGVITISKKNNNNLGSDSSMAKNNEVKIKESETKAIKFTDFDNGFIKMKIPEGWKVDVVGDCIHYTIKAYDPQRPTYQFFFNLKTEGYNKSEAAKAFQKRYYPDSMFAKTAVLSDKTTEGFYKIFNELGPLNNTAAFTLPTLTDFTVVENLGTSPIGGDILRATFKDENGKDAEGLFIAYVYDPGPYYVYENVVSGNQIDIYYLSVYDAIFITAPKDEFVNWEGPLNTIAGSLEFTDAFMNGFNSQQDAVMKEFQNVRSICNQISDGIMDSWAKRSASYDIMSQKQSDATLGYERVYDTENGDIYKAYNGFTDDYDGERYKPVTDDMYTQKTYGYIEK